MGAGETKGGEKRERDPEQAPTPRHSLPTESNARRARESVVQPGRGLFPSPSSSSWHLPWPHPWPLFGFGGFPVLRRGLSEAAVSPGEGKLGTSARILSRAFSKLGPEI